MDNIIYQEINWLDLKNALSCQSEKIRKEALVRIKDAVIGSNRQKGHLISYGLVPDIIEMSATKEDNIEYKMNALIILGSLAKGTPDQVEKLVTEYNIIPILVKRIVVEQKNAKCIEICLSTLRSIYENPTTPVELFSTDTCSLEYFLSLASDSSSLKTQICVTSILVSLCQTYNDQIRLLHAGTIHLLARMICFQNEHIQIPALRCLCCMCFANRLVTDNICVTSYKGRSLANILNSLLSRLYAVEIQLTAARCLTYIYRSGTLLSTDFRIRHKTLPCLTRLSSDSFEPSIRSDATETLAYLIEVDPELQRTAAISNHLLISLNQLIKNNQPSIRQAALLCFASLGASDETIRKKIIDFSAIVDAIQSGLHDSDSQVRLAAVKCVHSLSRSVQQLRTTFQDHMMWEPLNTLITSPPSLEFLLSVTSTICNLLLEFSPSKKSLIECGIISKLSRLIDHPEPSIRLNSIWALMNMSFQSSDRIKTDIINELGTSRIFNLLFDSDPAIILKTLGLIRNLLSRPHHINLVMSSNSIQILEAVNLILESNQFVEIKEQALCIISNIAAGSQGSDYILNDCKMMLRIEEFLFHSDHKLQTAALFVIHSIVHRSDFWTEEDFSRLTQLNIIKYIYDLEKKIVESNTIDEEYIHRLLKQIIVQYKKISPKILI